MTPEAPTYVHQKNNLSERPATLAEFVAAQVQRPTCQQNAASVSHPDPEIVRHQQWPTTETIRYISVHSSHSIWITPKCLPYPSLHPTLTRHTGHCRVYDRMTLEFHWPHIASYVYTKVDDCRLDSKRGAVMKHYDRQLSHQRPPHCSWSHSTSPVPFLKQRMEINMSSSLLTNIQN